ncbi:Fc.00g116360.m01.CDS01 [Cosmosporella sp. VM-42]
MYFNSDETQPDQPLCSIVTPVGMLGYGFDDTELNRGLELSQRMEMPTAIILDSGSTDSGPSKLALGSMTCPRSSYVRDLRKLLQVVTASRIPLIISSAGGDGSDRHVDEFLGIITEILSDPCGLNAQLKVITIYSEVDRSVVITKLEGGKVSGCGPSVPRLTMNDLESTPTIVGQIGPEPFLQVMVAHPDFDIIIGGRAYDPAPYVAFSAFQVMKHQYCPIISLPPNVLGGFTHMGKIMECGGLCATPKSKSSIATIYRNGTFDVRPLAAGSKCTTTSVAAHALYEKSRPDKLYGPGGCLCLASSTYSALPDGVSVRVRGSVFIPSQQENNKYTIKLEGAKVIGYRTIFMGSFGDQILIPQLPSLLKSVKAYVTQQHEGQEGEWQLGFHTYGNNARSDASSSSELPPSEVFLVGEALASNQALSTSIASTARIGCVHGPYKGQKANSGNFGMGIGGRLELETGPCAQFSIYHLMELEQGEEEALEVSLANGMKEEISNANCKAKCLFKWTINLIGAGGRLNARPMTSHPNGFQEQPPLLPPMNEGVHCSLSNSHTLGEISKVIRSKNAGPFEITLDVMFDNEVVYHQVKKSGVLNAKLISMLYNIATSDIIWCGFFDQALAFKVTIPRIRDGNFQSSGGFMENDVHGSQMYRALMDVNIDFS